MKPCHSPYCECDKGHCTHSGFRDACHEPVIAPATQFATATTDHKTLIYDMLDEVETEVEAADSAAGTVNINKVIGSDTMTINLTIVLQRKS